MSHEVKSASAAVEDDAWVDGVAADLADQRELLENVLDVVRGNRAMLVELRAEVDKLRKRRWWRFGR
ncbi:MAG: hypothetical protein KC503_17460 [Myxococcales bacterium]|nr:hypothetical protein [Myxococcales bacterium]